MRCELVTGVQTCALPILVGEIEPDAVGAGEQQRGNQEDRPARHLAFRRRRREMQLGLAVEAVDLCLEALDDLVAVETEVIGVRSEEHTSELQSLMRISYAVFCLKKKNNINITTRFYLILHYYVSHPRHSQHHTFHH